MVRDKCLYGKGLLGFGFILRPQLVGVHFERNAVVPAETRTVRQLEEFFGHSMQAARSIQSPAFGVSVQTLNARLG